MSRAVSADHIMFNECIAIFKNDKNFINLPVHEKSHSYILTPFYISENWILDICSIEKSIKVDLPRASMSFISKVKNPDWISKMYNPHLFGIALSTLFTFITQKPCKSIRNHYLCNREDLFEDDIKELAIINPILVAGPGCQSAILNTMKQEKYRNELNDLILVLNKIEDKNYIIAMQSIRLAHLSIINKKEDFGLAYLLIVSAIESVAQIAIKRDRIKKKNKFEEKWKSMANADANINELLNAYKEARGQNQYLKERFVDFIFKYIPPNCWEEIVEHPNTEFQESINKFSGESSNFRISRFFNGKYPCDFDDEELKKIIGDSYTYRSKFVHKGEQPPHTTPIRHNTFFEEINYFSYEEETETKIFLANYELLLSLHKYALLNWLDAKT